MASVCMGIICSARRRFDGYQSYDYSRDEWFEQQKAAGADIEVWFYENAAHGILAGPIDRGIRLYGGTMKRWA